MARAWMPLYIADYLADTQHLTTTQHGAYLLLIMHYWQHGKLPDTDEAIARISRLKPDQWRSNCKAIASMFQPGWKHKRIDRELDRARQISEKRAVLGAMGGRTNKGLNNAQRRNNRLTSEAIAKQKVAQSHKKEREEVAERSNGYTSELNDIVHRKGWV